MITVVRTLTVQDGKRAEALVWVGEVAAYAEVQALRSLSGPQNQLHLVANYESLAAWEADEQKLLVQPEFLELVEQRHDLFTNDHTVNIYEALE